MSKEKLVVKVTGDHILQAAILKHKGKPRAEYCPLALALKESGFPKASVADSDDEITLNGKSVRHTKRSADFIDEFDTWVDSSFTLERIPKPRTLRFSVSQEKN